jgi:DNA-binding response OmpR family regulator
LLKRSKTDEEIDLDTSSASGTVLVVNDDQDACELVARLVESAGWPADRHYDVHSLVDELEQRGHSAVIIDSLTIGITDAFKALDDIRSGSAKIRNVAIVIIASTDTNRLFAYQSGVDGFVVRPVHADELLDVLRMVFGRTNDERVEFRRAQLMGGATL